MRSRCRPADLFPATADALDEIWSPAHLERLARTYWRFLSRVTLGLMHVSYSEHERSIVLLVRPLKLLTFDAPEYEMDPLRGLVRWRIARGLLVARRGRDGGGYLQIEVRRTPPLVPAARAQRARLRVEVEVANFYPSIAFAPQPPALRRDAVAHPRDRHARLPALAATPGSGRVPGEAVRRSRLAAGVDHRPPGRAARSGSFSRYRLQLRAVVRGLMRLIVPDRERVTSDSVVAPPALG